MQDEERPRITLHQLLRVMIDRGASDLHITAGSPPQLRLDGSLVPLKTPPLSPVETKQLCYSVLTEEQKVKFEKTNELDLSFGVKGLSRFRANIYQQRGAVAGAFRAIPFRIRSLEELGAPPVLAELCRIPRGLVLVTGPTGSGKSTTLAAMIDKINTETRQHILTIEDPIEYLHPNKLCVVNQREIGVDTHSFPAALKYALRQDPDVVLIGEMRDLETIEAAMTISETGHLVFATLHTNSAVQSINRIIDVFPPHQQSQVRAQLSFVLQGVVTQTLIPRADGPGRVLCCEVLIPNHAIRNLIREDKIHQIYSIMQVGQGVSGMQTLNQALYALYSQGLITLEEAMGRSGDVAELQSMIEKRAPVTAFASAGAPAPRAAAPG
ncbi:MAG: type IV pilus twitching motility protein PilT [Myxococcota bacterium]|nr:type IV pilus twitching motility protein PilT [Myxococcota bacterium]MDW8362127.1 type IV pilus twitching motility protein PilT [Myxococcales bacterium]